MKRNDDRGSRTRLAGAAVLALIAVGGCAPADKPISNNNRGALASADTVSVTPPAATAPDARTSFDAVSRALGRPGVYRTPGVYVVTVPRDDLSAFVEGMEVPTAAGLESAFYFYYCPCGKTIVVGQFCVLDYEANDVIDALRAARIEVVSIAPMLLHVKETPMALRFQAEGKPEPLAAAIKEALRWTGKERMPAVAPNPVVPP